MLKEAATIQQSPGLHADLRITFGRLGETLTKLDRKDHAYEVFTQARALYEEDADAAGVRLCDRALVHLDGLMRHKIGVSEQEDLGLDLFQRGYELTGQQKWAEAIPLLERAEQHFRAAGNRRMAREALNHRSIAMRLNGQEPSATMVRAELEDLISTTLGTDVRLNAPQSSITWETAVGRSWRERVAAAWRASRTQWRRTPLIHWNGVQDRLLQTCIQPGDDHANRVNLLKKCSTW